MSDNNIKAMFNNKSVCHSSESQGMLKIYKLKMKLKTSERDIEAVKDANGYRIYKNAWFR